MGDVAAEFAVAAFWYFRIVLKVQAASCAVSGLPSDHLAFGTVWKVQTLPPSDICQLVAKSGTIASLGLYWTSEG